jgi:ribonuclease HI
MSRLNHVTIYTDGACIGNPGPGGYGVVLLYGEHRRELSGGYRKTTNNRMEILAAIVGLETLKYRCRVTLHSDSEYLVKAIEEGWAKRWRGNDWRRNKRERALNPDLWGRLLDLCDSHEVEFKWVRGHAGIPENERCDQLATQAARQPDLLVDEGYEAFQDSPAASLI